MGYRSGPRSWWGRAQSRRSVLAAGRPVGQHAPLPAVRGCPGRAGTVRDGRRERALRILLGGRADPDAVHDLGDRRPVSPGDHRASSGPFTRRSSPPPSLTAPITGCAARRQPASCAKSRPGGSPSPMRTSTPTRLGAGPSTSVTCLSPTGCSPSAMTPSCASKPGWPGAWRASRTKLSAGCCVLMRPGGCRAVPASKRKLPGRRARRPATPR